MSQQRPIGFMRQRIGPMNKALIELIKRAREPEFTTVSADLTVAEYAAKTKQSVVLMDKIERHIASLKDYDLRYSQALDNISEETLNEAESKKYSEFAFGDDGFTTTIMSAEDVVSELKGQISEIDQLKSALEKREQNHVFEMARDQSAGQPTTSTPAPPAIVHPSRFRISEIEIPKFSGELLKWRTFWELFKAAVDDDDSLTGVQKFTYLRSAVSGMAADLLEGMAITELNYKTAVDILKKRFGNEQIQRTALLRELNNLPRADNKYHELRRLVDTTSKLV